MALNGISSQAISDQAPASDAGAPQLHARASGFGHPAAYMLAVPVLTLLGAGTTLLAPMLLDPIAFGAFSILAIIFQYASTMDLGLSQMADREIGAKNVGAAQAAELLSTRWIIAGAMIIAALPLTLALAWSNGQLALLDTALAFLGGTAFMIANGPVTVHRAASRIRDFTIAAIALQFGMTFPRLFGLALGGVTGCVLALAIWYGALAVLLARPGSDKAKIQLTRAWALVRAALPLFAFQGLWLVYVSANRWMSLGLSTPRDFGLFAFTANFAFVAIGVLSTVAQVRYPRLLRQVAHSSGASGSGPIERDIVGLSLALAAAAVVAILVAQPVITWIFPNYAGATPAVAGLAISCIPLGILAWTLPISIALSARPWADAALMFGPALAVLGGSMLVGHALNGIAGQAVGCAVAALALLVIHSGLMRRLDILATRACLRIVLLQAVLVGALLALTPTASHPSAEQIGTLEGPPPGWQLSFEDTFDGLALRNGDAGVWEPHYPWGARTNPPNRELQYYVDPRPERDPRPLANLVPFVLKDGILAIQAHPIHQDARHLAPNLRYASGLLTTARSFSFTYGYAEIRARMPRGKGLWPAFWLIPVDQSWPPEIDVLEFIADAPYEYWASAHWLKGDKPAKAMHRIPSPDLSEDFHTFAVKWTADEIVWSLDGHRVAAVATPAGMHKPMYLVVNLAVGGDWPGEPNASTEFPARLLVDHIRVYRPTSSDQP